MGQKLGGNALFGEGELSPDLTQCGRRRGRVMFYLDPFNRLATIHRCHRQDRPTDRTNRQRSDSI